VRPSRCSVSVFGDYKFLSFGVQKSKTKVSELDRLQSRVLDVHDASIKYVLCDT